MLWLIAAWVLAGLISVRFIFWLFPEDSLTVADLAILLLACAAWPCVWLAIGIHYLNDWAPWNIVIWRRNRKGGEKGK